MLVSPEVLRLVFTFVGTHGLQLFFFDTNLTKPLQANLDEPGLQRALRHYASGAQVCLVEKKPS